MKKKAGVADNKSYKDMYHFTDIYSGNDREDLPSLNVDPAINSTIKENPYRSNVEIEGDEIVLKPDLSALFRAVGKKHSKGGMDVMLPTDSFIYSDDKTLAFNERDHKLFEFKKGGSFKPDKNTPAEVLKRNIDIKHYNNLISNITDIKNDDLAKKSSTMMLEKYMETLGQIAYLQEQKKDFPTGIPDFAANTAPIYNPEVKTDVMQQKQYAKYGGRIGNQYRAAGGPIDLECPCGRDATGKCVTPCDSKEYQRVLGTTTTKYDQVPAGFQQLYTDPSTGKTLVGKFVNGQGRPQTPGPKMSDADWTKFINSPAGRASRAGRMGYNNEEYGYLQPQNVELPPVTVHPRPKTPAIPEIPAPIPNPVTGEPQQGVDINWVFNKWQRLSQGYNLTKLATAKRYMPYRSHLNPSYVDPALVNPEQAVGDMQGSSNQQLQALGSLSPILRNTQASSFQGSLLDKIPSLRAAYDNQNAQIINQNRQSNNAIANHAREVNMANDQNYYQQSVVGQQNFDNLKTFLGDQYMNNLNQDVMDNQSLAYKLATLNNPAFGYNFRTGNFYRNQKDIRDVPGTGRADVLSTYLDKITQDWGDLDNKDRINLLKVMTAKNFATNPQKKGGMLRPMKKK